jgi:hypothetical protein
LSDSVRRFHETAKKDGAPSAADVTQLLEGAGAAPSPRRWSGGDGVGVGLGDVQLADWLKAGVGPFAVPDNTKGAVGPISHELNNRFELERDEQIPPVA